MRGTTAILFVFLAGALAAASQVLLHREPEAWLQPTVYVWSAVTVLTLLSLLWLYIQIALGPSTTVGEETVARIERGLESARSRGWFREGRLKRFTREAAALAGSIEPAQEARNVYLRRVRLTNAILALIIVLTLAFWVLASLGPLLWPHDPLFENEGADGRPDMVRAALFSVDQITRGTMFDVFDVFDWSLSGLHNNPQNVVFSSLVVLYRLFVGGALVVALAVRLGMREDWRERVAREQAEGIKSRLEKLAAA